jgi:hypothetical protein
MKISVKLFYIALFTAPLSVAANAQQPAAQPPASNQPTASAQAGPAAPAAAAEAPAAPLASTIQPVKACLIVKHKGTVGRRLVWTALIGVPIAPGASYDYVDSNGMSSTKMAYKGKELQKMQGTGVKVIVLQNKYSTADVDGARKSCKGE